MSLYDLKYLKTELYSYRACERFFQSPIDLEPLQSLILQKERENEDDGDNSGTSSTKKYTDFLLPLPEHLQQTEIGVPDPSVIAQRRKESGIDNKISEPSKKARKELKARAELKNKLQIRPGPSRKIKIAPRPGGFTQITDGE